MEVKTWKNSLIYVHLGIMKPTQLLCLTLLATSLFSCTTGNVDIDNGSTERLTITIDYTDTHSMEPGSYKMVDLPSGVHHILVEDADGNARIDKKITVKEGGLLNVGGSEYYIWTDLYGNPGLKPDKLEEKWVDIGGKSFYGEFYRLDNQDLYTEKRWDFGLNQSFPDDLLGWQWQMSKEKYLIRSKLFRDDQLITAYNSLVKNGSVQGAVPGG